MRFGALKETLFKTMDSNFQESINIQDNNKYLNIHSRYRKLKNLFINSKKYISNCKRELQFPIHKTI